MNILLTGIDGYVGWPTALKLSKIYPDAQIFGVDNLKRRAWVEECGSVSAVAISDMETRIAAARENGFKNISFIEGDLTDRDFVLRIFRMYRFDAVLHLAAQPSAPYSQIDGACANYTQFNNNQSLRNLLWSIKECGLTEKCKLIATTTTGVYGAPAYPIPEGFVTAEHKGIQDTILHPGMAGSWYHMSRTFDVCNLWLANRQWKTSVMDLRTSIVYGLETVESALDPRLATRFDFDFYFGIVLNRFCAMALTGYPLTIYGRGDQMKPFISLDDCAESCARAISADFTGRFVVYNQMTETVSIKDMAYGIRDAAQKLGVTVEVAHIENPRVENEEHKMLMDNDGFLSLLPNKPKRYEELIEGIIRGLLPLREVLSAHKNRFMN
ncbi:MAG: GDP-mannose 4,6-dehydratase [Desulfovibrio sp.]